MKKLLLALLLLALSITGFSKSKKITVGAKGFTEGYVVGNLVSELLKENGFKVKETFGLTTFPIRKALESGQIDLYAEYTGTAWGAIFKKKELINEPVKLYEEVKKYDMKKNKIVWLDMMNINNTYALAIREKDANRFGLKTLSDLSRFIENNPKAYKFAINPEFYKRADGFWAMAKNYDMKLPKKQVKIMDSGITYEATETGKTDVAMVYSTDAKLRKHHLVVLEDDKKFFPFYNPAVGIRKKTLDKYPEVKDILKILSETLTEKEVIELNYKVDVEGKEPKVVAKEYLKSKGLIK